MDSVPTVSQQESVVMPAQLADRSDQTELANLPQKMPAAFSGEVLLHGAFPPQQQVRVIISQVALQQIQAHANSDLGRELGGVLLGQVCRHQAQTFVEVLDAMPAPTTDHGPIHFTFTADTWVHINRQREKEHPHLEVVGWFHTHPALGVFYSSDDVVVHSAAFTLPWQVGLVVDPFRKEACFFGWESSGLGKQLLPIAGFYEWIDQTAGTILNWRVTYQTSWVENYKQDPLPQSPHSSQTSEIHYLPNISPWWGVFIGSLALLISLGLLIERFLTS